MLTPSLPKSAPGASPSAANRKAEDSYHHGDLRSALIAAAREALETTAPQDISLKSLALRVGVSQPAPYRHFQSREALLAVVAADGFDRFREALQVAGEGASETERLERTGAAYLAFARTNWGVYRLMFASSLLKTEDDETLALAANAGFQLLLQDVSHYAPADKIEQTALWVWSTLHGLAMLEAEGMVGRLFAGPAMPAQIIKQMIETLCIVKSLKEV